MSGRILIAGMHSGCGKTTVTCALLSALKARGLDLAAFKCGPDYIDPLFHREVLGIPSHNLDPFFSSEKQLRAQLAGQAESLSVIEGVMGYYDGIGTEGLASTYEVARDTDTHTILVLNAKGMYTSAGAILKGFLEFKPHSKVAGVIFNGISPALYEGLKSIAQDAGVTPLGFLPYDENLTVGSRHLGLITAGEITNLKEKLFTLGALAERHIDIEGILKLATAAPVLYEKTQKHQPIAKVRVAVAQDRAFCFLYEENLELLRSSGATPIFFSPITDEALPENIDALYLPGGYPELYAKELSENASMRDSIKAAVEGGLPTIAECGGFLYLHDTLDGFPMAGAIHAQAYKTETLKRFGYATLTAKRESLLFDAGESMRVHEFHYYESDACGDEFVAQKPQSNRMWECGHASDTLYAAFPHLYFPVKPNLVERFVKKASETTVPHG